MNAPLPCARAGVASSGCGELGAVPASDQRLAIELDQVGLPVDNRLADRNGAGQDGVGRVAKGWSTRDAGVPRFLARRVKQHALKAMIGAGLPTSRRRERRQGHASQIEPACFQRAASAAVKHCGRRY